MTMQEQLRAAMLAAQQTVHDSSPVVPTPDPTPVNVTTPDTFVSVADAAAPTIDTAIRERKKVKIKSLNEKACLIKVKRRMYSPYKHDTEETRNYGVGNVNKRLFEGRNNRVAETISKFNDVYTYLKDHTVPWDTGTDMINMLHYQDIMAELRRRISIAEAAADDLEAHWHEEVQADLVRIRNKCMAQGKPDRSDPNDYPDTVRDRFSIDIRVMPVPSTKHFHDDPRFGPTDDDIASLDRLLDEVESETSKHVIAQMTEPMAAAVAKLKTSIGDDGSIFRDSLIDNMVDAADRMAKVYIGDDPEIADRIDDLRSLVGTYANNKDVLRNDQIVRSKCATQIDTLMTQMQGLV